MEWDGVIYTEPEALIQGKSERGGLGAIVECALKDLAGLVPKGEPVTFTIENRHYFGQQKTGAFTSREVLSFTVCQVYEHFEKEK